MALIWLKGESPGGYVQAWNGGGSELYARAGLIFEWESFTLGDETATHGPYLRIGDTIALQASNGKYVSVQMHLTDKPLLAVAGEANSWEKFRLESAAGPSIDVGKVIDNVDKAEQGTVVALKSLAAEKYVQVRHDHEMKRLVALAGEVHGWERFTIGFAGGNRERPSYATWRDMAPVQ